MIGAIANVINIVDVVPVIVHDLRVCYLKGGELSQMHKNMHTQLLKMWKMDKQSSVFDHAVCILYYCEL